MVFAAQWICRRTTFAFLACFLLRSLSIAQTPNNVSDKPSPTHQLSFSVYPIGNTNWQEIYYQKEPGCYEALTFWSYERSPKHSYKGTFPLQVFRKHTNPEPKGDPIYQPVGSCTPSSRSDAHLLFFVALQATDPASSHTSKEFEILPLDESTRSFPLDTVTFVNATGAKLEGVFGNQPIVLKQSISAPYDLRNCYQKETFIGLAVQVEGHLQKVLHCKWSFYPNYREIILLLPPKESGSMRVQAFRVSQHKEEIDPSTTIR